MTSLFMDTSALMKWYVNEKGSSRVRNLIEEKENKIHLSQISLPETTAALSANARAPKGISDAELQRAIEGFLKDCDEFFQLADVSRSIVDRAVKITQRRKIRGCDAIQLATALVLNAALREEDLPDLVFVACDKDLLSAAKAEGLATENPEDNQE